MASDSPDSSRKHPHSPSEDESQDRSKRHKHRHHHSHRHRSHHRHRHHRRGEGSGDRGEERKDDAEAANGDQNGGGVEEVRETARLGKTEADYDMEEGEIVEDADLAAGGADFGSKMEVSESESGEIRAVGASSRVDDSDTRRDQSSGENNCEHIGELDSPRNGRGNENLANGDAGYPLDKADRGDSLMHGRSSTPVKVRDKHKVRSGAGVEEVASLNRYSKSSQVLSDVRYHDETLHRNRSKSPNNLRRKSHSQATFADEDTSQGHVHVHHNNGNAEYVLDDDRTNLLGRESRSHRERKHAAGDEKHCNDRDSWEKDSVEKYGDRKIEKDRKVKHRDHEEERQLQERDRKRESSRTRELKNEKVHDRRGERPRERSRDIIRNGEYEEDRYKEKNHRRSKERDLERERQRESSRSSYRDRERETEREKDRERYRGRSRDVQERSRDSGNDRYRDKLRDAERDRLSRRYGRDDEDRYGGYGRSYDPKHHVYDGEDHRRDKKRTYDLEKDRSSRDDPFKQSENKVDSYEADQDDYPDNMELELVEQEEEDVNKIKEESRKRREAILKKYRTQELQQKVQPRPDTDEQALDKEISGGSSGVLVAAPALPSNTSNEDQAFPLGKSPPLNEASMAEKTTSAGALGQGTPKSERSNDMFGEDIFGDSPAGVHKTSERPNDMFSDDIFVDSPAGVRKTGKGDGLLVDRGGLHDNWDDPEGYYGYRLGEILDGRYEIAAAHGKGVFSTVVRAKDLKAGSGDPEEVAIKIIRNNDTMLKAGMDELIILRKLVGADPDDRRHCVRYISSFKYRNHLCLVFESLNMNLREVLKKFGRNIGLKLTAVRAYAKQLFIALKHLKNCGVLHCDIKPDNMLVNDAKNVLKLCDFGNAMFAGKNEVTPYLVSRFYRAPEIILGLAYDHPLDIWSVGCCLYELSTGKVLFPGATNNDMLRLHMELKGPFPKKMLRKGAFTHQHFDQDLNFHSIEEDLVSKKAVRRLIVNIKPKDIGMIIKGSPGEDPKMLANFKDLLDKIFVLDPDKRLTVSQALNHPFITGK